MGDGIVVLILDIYGLVEIVNIILEEIDLQIIKL